jgi:YHS domain-containing protein
VRWTLLIVGGLVFACEAAPPKILGGYEAPVALGTMIQDAVDGAQCVRDTDTEVAVFRERNFYFCVPEHREVFNLRPAKYGLK